MDKEKEVVTIDDISKAIGSIAMTTNSLESKITCLIANVAKVDFTDIDKKVGDAMVSDLLDSEIVNLVNQIHALLATENRILLRIIQLQNDRKVNTMGFTSSDVNPNTTDEGEK